MGEWCWKCDRMCSAVCVWRLTTGNGGEHVWCKKKRRITDIWEKTTGCFTGLSHHSIEVEGKSVSCVDTDIYTVNYWNAKTNRVHHMILQLNSLLLRGHQYYHVCCNAIFRIHQSHNKIAFITSLELLVCLLCSHGPSSQLFLEVKNLTNTFRHKYAHSLAK